MFTSKFFKRYNNNFRYAMDKLIPDEDEKSCTHMAIYIDSMTNLRLVERSIRDNQDILSIDLHVSAAIIQNRMTKSEANKLIGSIREKLSKNNFKVGRSSSNQYLEVKTYHPRIFIR